MPVVKDLDELIKNILKIEEEKMRRIEKEINKEFERLFADFNSPLYSFTETENEYDYLIDMPKVDLSTLRVESRPQKLLVACKTKDGKEYRLTISLPEDADPSTMEVSKAKWLLKVSIKKRK